MNLKILYQSIGTLDETLDCLYPIYLLHPELPKVTKVDEPKKGDILVFNIFGSIHFGVFAGNNKFFHSCNKHKLRISRLSMYKKFLRGSYKWQT